MRSETTKIYMMKNIKFFAIVIMAFGLTQCKVGTKTSMTDVLPVEPDYNDSTQWYVSDRQSEADVFYIISTETGDYPLPDGHVCHFADTYNDSVRTPLYSEMLGVDTLLSGKLNYYSPYYRQCSLQSFTNDSIAKARIPIALGDVRRAFRHYLTHFNTHRPFILAGFSQGAMMMVELMKEMDEDVYRRMIAAYAFGISITQEMMDSCKYIVPARNANDTGVTICYNSVRDAHAFTGKKSMIAINPANWRTDATATVFMTEPTPWLPISEQKKDTLTVHLDTLSNLLFVDGYTATDYVLPLIGKEGNYHSREIWLYRHQLRDNMALRAMSFLKNK